MFAVATRSFVCASPNRARGEPRPFTRQGSNAYAAAMNDRISQILARMAELEGELRSAVHEQESRMFFQIDGKRVEFERSVREAHLKLKTDFFRWLVTDRPQNLVTGPLIYGMILPLPSIRERARSRPSITQNRQCACFDSRDAPCVTLFALAPRQSVATSSAVGATHRVRYSGSAEGLGKCLIPKETTRTPAGRFFPLRSAARRARAFPATPRSPA